MADDHFKELYFDLITVFDRDPTAIQFLRQDGEGGLSSGVYRMAREIDRLRKKCGEPPERPADWEEAEDAETDKQIAIEMAKLRGVTAQ